MNKPYTPWYEDYKVPEYTNACISETLHKNVRVYASDDDFEEITNKNNESLEETLKKVIYFLHSITYALDINDDDDTIKNLINSCKGWIQDERVVVKDD